MADCEKEALNEHSSVHLLLSARQSFWLLTGAKEAANLQGSQQT